MKHGVAFRKFSRTSSHRMLMLRNLVTSLLQHEQIKTTLPKARDTARLAEKIITMGKKGDLPSQGRASSFLLDQSLVPKLFGSLAKRYADRPGGYTRIHKFGNRKGDNAPHAILELVDNPHDLRWEMTSRAAGWELLRDKLQKQTPLSIINSQQNTQDIVQESVSEGPPAQDPFRPKTRWNMQKIFRFRGKGAVSQFSRKTNEYMTQLLAEPVTLRGLYQEAKEKNSQSLPPRPRAGQISPGDTRAGLKLSRGDLGHPQKGNTGRILDLGHTFGRKYART
ncbi:ribosomal protein L17 [Pluteus cervinus]|uniref:Ribosomal protein L17 n=1 Tax=Pluteus cervinus TaxID=181527 RepID=A0ACD3BG58_9AGAR|nr:ribosomal protein L17 [Pluteus cervinus]